MASFNEIDGIPATGNKWLLTDVLRKQWGFRGFVVTDYTGINEMIDHGMGDLQTVSALALNAGIDMDMVGEGLLTTLPKSLKEGKVTIEKINEACRAVLNAKYKLGLFDNPYKYCDVNRSKNEIFTPQHRAIARKTAAESFVLMKNENNTLPLQSSAKIALVGPLADAQLNMTGTWSVAAVNNQSITVLQGLRNAVNNPAQISYAKGSNLTADKALEDRATVFGKSLNRDNRSQQELLNEAIEISKNADVIVAALGESAEFSGESSSRTNLDIPDVQKHLLMELSKLGKPIILLVFNGRPLTLSWENEHIPAILDVWFPGSEAGDAISDVIFGKVNPSGKLSMTFPQNVGQIPIYYNHKNTGRPLPDGQWFQKFRSNYLDVSNDPLYPFGYGLSYSTFVYGTMRTSSTNLKGNQGLTVSVDVSNKSNATGKEVVQLYIRDVVGSVTRPVKELKGFQKVEIPANQTKTVSFVITTEDLKFYNYDLKYDWEGGDFDILIGTNSNDVQKVRVNWQK